MNTAAQSVHDSTIPDSLELPRFSLIVATVDRTAELAKLLDSLQKQSYQNFEIIVIDQNPDNRVEPVLTTFRDCLDIRHLRSEKGLSRARNVGLCQATGDIVAFPDDDCWYEPRVLGRFARMFLAHPEWDGISGKCNAPRAFHFQDQREGDISKLNVWRRSTSATMFLRKSVIDRVGGFDETLGVGSASGRASAEDVDYLLRAIDSQFWLHYCPDLLIDHPDASPVFDRRAREKGFAYGRGMGYAIRKHKYPLWFLGYVLFRAAGGAVLSLLNSDLNKARYHCAAFRGRLSGWLEQN